MAEIFQPRDDSERYRDLPPHLVLMDKGDRLAMRKPATALTHYSEALDNLIDNPPATPAKMSGYLLDMSALQYNIGEVIRANGDPAIARDMLNCAQATIDQCALIVPSRNEDPAISAMLFLIARSRGIATLADTSSQESTLDRLQKAVNDFRAAEGYRIRFTEPDAHPDRDLNAALIFATHRIVSTDQKLVRYSPTDPVAGKRRRILPPRSILAGLGIPRRPDYTILGPLASEFIDFSPVDRPS